MTETVAVDDPLAQLDPYEVRHLPRHLAAARESEALHRLLALRRSDGSNAWYATRGDIVAYLQDVAAAREAASRDRDYGQWIRYALVANGVRRSASVSPALLEALVDRGRLPLDAAVAIARSAPRRDQLLLGLIRLLPRMPPPQRAAVTAEVIHGMQRREPSRSGIGLEYESPGLPLNQRQHWEAVIELAAMPHVLAGFPDELIAVARSNAGHFGVARSLATVAGGLDEGRSRRCLDEAWSAACSAGIFEGRAEAQAFVAARFPVESGRAQVETALSSTLESLHAADERRAYLGWSPFAYGENFSRPALLRFHEFAQPVRDLAPLLTGEQVYRVLQVCFRGEAMDAQWAFTAIALLPRVAELGEVTAAWQRASSFGMLSMLAMGTMAEAGWRLPHAMGGDVFEVTRSIEDPVVRVLTMLAVPALDPRRRVDVVDHLLRDTGPESAFRADIVQWLIPHLRALPAQARTTLLDELARGDPALVRSEEEAATLLDSTMDLMPTTTLDTLLARARSIAPSLDLTASPPAADTAPEKRKLATPGTADAEPDTIAAALSVARAAPEGARQNILTFLAPLVDDFHLAEAVAVAGSIKRPQLRAEPLWRLIEGCPAKHLDVATDCVRSLLQVSGNLSRLGALISDIATVMDGRMPPAMIQALDTFLREVTDDEAVLAVLPLCRAAGCQDPHRIAAQTVDDLGTWFGGLAGASTDAPAANRKPGAPSTEGPPLFAAAAGGGRFLVEALAARQQWDGVAICMRRLRDLGEAAATELARAEEHLLDVLDERSTPQHRAIVEEFAGAATGPTRSAAVAALLRDAVSRRDADAAARLITRLQAAGGAHTGLARLRMINTVMQAHILVGDPASAGRELRLLLAAVDPYTSESGRIASRAAGELRVAADAAHAADRAYEAALREFLDFAARHPQDYELQEATGGILRDRVASAVWAGRPVDTRWLTRLDALADADHPDEVLLHTLALEAVCAAAPAMSDVREAVYWAGIAFRRWRRHPELSQCATTFTSTALSIRAGEEELACLAGIVALRSAPENIPAAVRRRLRAVRNLPRTVADLARLGAITPSDADILLRAGPTP